jgi:hypothetical protein
MVGSEWWDTEEVAIYLKKLKPDGRPNGMAVEKLRQLHPDFPKPYKLGPRTNFYDPSEIRAWVKARPRSMDEMTNGPKSKRGRPPKALVKS